MNYLASHPELVGSLQQKTTYFRNLLKQAGIVPLEGGSAIIPVMIGDTATAIKIASAMLSKGVYAIGFGFPVVPEGTARIRIQVSDALTYQDIDQAVKVIKEVFDEVKYHHMREE